MPFAKATIPRPDAELGSVQMEFIVVLPIYMMLLGFAFVCGEFSIETIHLAGSADRSRAHSSDAFSKYRRAASPTADDANNLDGGAETALSYAGDAYASGDANVSEYRSETASYAVDDEIEGPWAEMTAAKVADDYTLPPWTRGLVAFWYNRRVELTDGMESVGEAPALDDILDNGFGRTEVKGKDLSAQGGGDSARKYGHYTLRRHAEGRTSRRSWGAGRLHGGADAGEWEKVRDEKFASDSVPGGARASSHEAVDGGGRAGKPSPGGWKDMYSALAPYSREADLVNWSN